MKRRIAVLGWRLGCTTLVIAAATMAAVGSAASALMAAAERHDVVAARGLLAGGADVNAVEADGSTALHAAAENDDVAMATLLLAAGADAHGATRYGITPLSLAAANGSAAMIECLLDAGADPNETSREGQTALMSAALNGRAEAIELLLTRGAKVDAREPYHGQTALMWAAAAGNVAAVAALIEAGADLSARSTGGFTALLLAVRENRIDAARRLLEHGANVEDAAPDGTSALNLAVVNAGYDLAVLLLEQGADPNVADPRGSALHTLAWLNKPGSTWDAAALSAEPETAPRPIGRVGALELAQRLLERGANPNARIDFEEEPFSMNGGTTRNPPDLLLGRHYLSYVGATPFYIAARNGDVRFMELLARHGADARISTRSGVTPLMAAAGLDYYEGETPGPSTGVPETERLAAVKLALALGNDIHARTHFGDYPMIGTAESTLLTYPRNMRNLLLLGVGDPRFDGMTALHGAVISNQPSIVEFLIAQGAEVEARNDLGWTPLMMAEGLFLANAKKEFPAAAALLREAIADRSGGD